MKTESLTVPIWVNALPDGAVSVSSSDGKLLLKASRSLQKRFEELLDRKKAGALPPKEEEEYRAICELDDALSWLNRLARRSAA
jgi:hypothetical protein